MQMPYYIKQIILYSYYITDILYSIGTLYNMIIMYAYLAHTHLISGTFTYFVVGIGGKGGNIFLSRKKAGNYHHGV